MNFNDWVSLVLYDFKRDAVFQLVNEPAAIALLLLFEADGIDGLGKLVYGELEVDTSSSVQFTGFLKKSDKRPEKC